ncbi:MAG: hypothetical protein U9N82_06450 [Thermodesulfobacteriota bacterium]|nr:hypothetical protein [Thermodesulfobacteriota bacterium]
MGNIIKDIIDAEGTFLEAIEKAKLDYEGEIEKVREELNHKKAQMENEISENNKQRVRSAVEKAEKQVGEELKEIGKEKDTLMQDKQLCETIEGRIVSIILGT